jgi:hypothetical protein
VPNSKVEIDLRRPLAEATLVVQFHMTREFRIRMWLAITLLRLASRLLGCEIRFEDEDDEGVQNTRGEP